MCQKNGDKWAFLLQSWLSEVKKTLGTVTCRHEKMPHVFVASNSCTVYDTVGLAMPELVDSYGDLHKDIDGNIDEYIIRAKLNAVDDEGLLETLLRRGGAGEMAESLAKELITQFGSIIQVINAPREQLRTVKGIDRAMMDEITVFRAGVLCVLRADMMAGPITHSWDSLKKYCECLMLNATAEELRIIYLDKALRIKREELHQRGTVDTVGMYENEVVRNALAFGASTILFVRLRPFHLATISSSFEENLARFAQNLKWLGIDVYDYVVVSPGDTLRLRELNRPQHEDEFVPLPPQEVPIDPSRLSGGGSAARIVAFPASLNNAPRRQPGRRARRA